MCAAFAVICRNLFASQPFVIIINIENRKLMDEKTQSQAPFALFLRSKVKTEASFPIGKYNHGKSLKCDTLPLNHPAFRSSIWPSWYVSAPSLPPSSRLCSVAVPAPGRAGSPLLDTPREVKGHRSAHRDWEARGGLAICYKEGCFMSAYRDSCVRSWFTRTKAKTDWTCLSNPVTRSRPSECEWSDWYWLDQIHLKREVFEKKLALFLPCWARYYQQQRVCGVSWQISNCKAKFPNYTVTAE